MIEGLEKLVQEEVEKRQADVLKENRTLKTKNTNLNKKNLSLKKENEALLAENTLFSKEKTRNNKVESLIGLINTKKDDNRRGYRDSKYSHKMEEIIKVLDIPQSFDEEAGMHDVPDWFKLIVNHYEHRHTVLDVFDFFGLEYDRWARDFRLPHDYTREEVLYCLQKSSKIGNTNSCYFKGNIGFWFDNSRNYLSNVKKMMNDSWSSVNMPWQYFLKNIHLTQDEECIELVCKQLKKDSGNAEQYIQIFDYQQIDPELAQRFLKSYKTTGRNNYVYDYKVKTKQKYIKQFIKQINDKSLIKWFREQEGYSFSQSFPIEYHYEELNKKDNYQQVVSFVVQDEKFSPREKQKLLLKAIDDYYSDAMIAEKALRGEM